MKLLKELTEAEFERFVRPVLPYKVSGRNDKIPLYKTYNYIAKVLRTGMQWSELQDSIDKDATGKPEIHYTSVWKRYRQWCIFRVFERQFHQVLLECHQQAQIDLTVMNGDGTNTVAKKGAVVVATLVINTK